MALMNVDGQDNALDNALQRQGFGTLGTEHMVPSGIGGTATNSVITIVDPAVQYFSNSAPGTTGWQLQDGINAYGFLAYSAHASFPTAALTVNFTGTKIAVLGSTLASGGRMNAYIDGNLATGAVNTSTPLSIQYYTTPLGLTDTTIMLFDTTSFSSTGGQVVIDAEEISYTGISGSSLIGCTRGINGTKAASHKPTTTVYAISSTIELYSPYVQDRIYVWRKNNLSPGNHTLTLQIRADANAASTGTFVNINGFVVGSVLGATNIVTSTRYIDLGTATTDANGQLGPYVISPPNTTMQLLGIIGCYPVSGATWAFPMYNPNLDELSIVTNAASASVHVVLTALYLSESI